MTEIEAYKWSRPNPFIEYITVRDVHTDRLGHTNNVRYLEWLEAIAWRHIEDLGFGWAKMEESGFTLPITKTELSYLRPSYEGDKLILGTWVTFNDERFRCSREFEIIRSGDLTRILTAKMEFACVHLKTGKPAKMPENMSKALNAGVEPCGDFEK